jgi:polyhydroxyalkanoate synthesis regulator phasin
MSDSLFDQLRARGEGFFTEISNNLMANPAFIEVLKKGIAAKEQVDKRVAEALKTVNVATRKDVSRLEKRLAELEAELEAVNAKLRAKTARSPRKASGRKGQARNGG